MLLLIRYFSNFNLFPLGCDGCVLGAKCIIFVAGRSISGFEVSCCSRFINALSNFRGTADIVMPDVGFGTLEEEGGKGWVELYVAFDDRLTQMSCVSSLDELVFSTNSGCLPLFL